MSAFDWERERVDSFRPQCISSQNTSYMGCASRASVKTTAICASWRLAAICLPIKEHRAENGGDIESCACQMTDSTLGVQKICGVCASLYICLEKGE